MTNGTTITDTDERDRLNNATRPDTDTDAEDREIAALYENESDNDNKGDELEGEEDDSDEDDEDDEDESELDAAPAAPVSDLDSEEKVRLMAAAADAVRAGDIIALDLRELTIITDFFLICTGKSSIQIRAIADRIEDRLREHGLRKLRVEGYQEATWILLDYGDVVAHIMAEQQRDFYRLEQFWADAPEIKLELAPEPGIAATSTPSMPYTAATRF